MLRDDVRYGGVGGVALGLLAQLVVIDAHALEAFILLQSEGMRLRCNKGLASSSNRSPRMKAQPYSTPLHMSAMPQNTIHQQTLSSWYAKHHPKPVLHET